MIRTQATLKVAAALLAKPNERHYGYELWIQTKISTGTLYPILIRMLRDGLLSDGWQSPEDMGPRQRLPRRYYTLTDRGRAELGALFERTEVKR